MARFELRFKQSVAKDLRGIPKTEVRRLLKRIQALGDEPRPAGCEKLTGRDLYRIRQGVYRIVYSVDNAAVVIEVIKVGHRRDVYRTPQPPRSDAIYALCRCTCRQVNARAPGEP